ncbi:MAG: cytochrome c3 family protein [Gammaproteobacteria bacterium]|nr:cytochrome c3 family protein [Gammaproteobacteria bacterium]
MRNAFLALLALGVLVVLSGSPLTGPRPVRDRYFAAPEPILPMIFDHNDHGDVNCIECHHDFADDSGSGMCMGCHVSDPDLWPRLEQQFHGLCLGCHAEREAAGRSAGPPRACDGCHHGGGPATP